GKSDLQKALLAHFKRRSLKAIAEDVYAGVLSRDQLASFAARVGELAEHGDGTARGLIDKAAIELFRLVMMTVRKLGLESQPLEISYGGGVFKSRRLLARFTAEISVELPLAQVVAPRYGPEIGALLLAYRQAGKKLTPKLLDSLTETQK
ncbi:MAG TPA: hypothetical protein PKC13_15755, partial [Blastocatellia bacterium]|nr:hypothetical protein [Blastocatellia bacterium]